MNILIIHPNITQKRIAERDILNDAHPAPGVDIQIRHMLADPQQVWSRTRGLYFDVVIGMHWLDFASRQMVQERIRKSD